MIRYSEVQQFRQPWLRLLVGTIAVGLVSVFGYGMFRQLLLGQAWGGRPLSDLALAIVGTLMIGLGLGSVYLMYTLRLVTEVRDNGVYIDCCPLARQTILFRDVTSCDVRTYKPVLEYGGWGVRYGPSGKAYNASGNRGVQLRLSNGQELLIGSQHPEELAQAIQSGMAA